MLRVKWLSVSQQSLSCRLLLQIYRRIKRQNTFRRVLCIDTEFSRYTPKDGERTTSVLLDTAVYNPCGKIVIDTHQIR